MKKLMRLVLGAWPVLRSVCVGGCMVLGAGAAFAEPSVAITNVKLADARDGTVEYAYTVSGDFEGWNYDLIVEISADEGTGYRRTTALTFENIKVGSATKVVNIKELFGFASPCVSFFVTLKKAGIRLWAGGPIFAECNTDATKPEEYGGLYTFSAGNAEFAAERLGNGWRLPTKKEFEALLRNCNHEWTEQNGVKGRRFTGKGDYSSRSIFLPAAGYSVGFARESDGAVGCYWSSTKSGFEVLYLKFLNDDAYNALYNNNTVFSSSMSVRAVREAAE